MNNFPAFLHLKLGIYVKYFVDWLIKNFGEFFEALTEALLWFLGQVESFFLWLPWWVVVGGVCFLGWRLRKLSTGITFALLMLLIGSFKLWDATMATMALVLTSVVFSLVIGIPLGILMAYSERTSTLMKPVLDAMQTMPSFVYLIPAVMLFNLGKVPATFATIIYAVPPVMRLTELGIRRVPREMVEAAHSFGSTAWQTLVKVQLPQALPTIMTGINQTTMMALSMVVIASMIGAKGLGMEIMIAISRLDIARGFEAGISVVILAIIIDRLSQGLVHKFKFPE
jgi:glycine betaine/proline transport system permease protein